MWFGKIIGFLLGLQMGGLMGGLLGLWVGNYFDRGMVDMGRRPPEQRRSVVQEVFYETVFLLMGHLAKVDGRISESEIAQAENLMAQMGLTDEHRLQAIELFRRGSKSDFSVDDVMIRFQSECGRYHQLQKILLEYLCHIAFADGELHPAERQYLADVASWLGISGAVFDRLLQMFQAQYRFAAGGVAASEKDQLQAAYVALGVDASASDRDVKSAYRKLMSRHHPDKLIAQGVPEDMLAVATQKSQEISAAYDLIMKSRA